MKTYLILYSIFFLVSAVPSLAQSVDSTSTDTLQVLPDTFSNLTSGDDEIIKPIAPWEKRTPLFSEQITSDSLLRWNIFPNWGDFYAYRSEVISFRQGTIGREDAFLINGFNPYEHNLYLDDVLLNDPITGLVNYNFVPHHKIGSVYEKYRTNLTSEINIRNYYINDPISYLNFDEAGNDYRNLEFMVAQNTSQGTNVELSFWDRREGGFYQNNEVEGSQVVGRLYHHLGNRYQLQALVLRNEFNNEESGGYILNDPLQFGFNEFTSSPRSSGGRSENLRTDMKLGLYQRADSAGQENGGLLFVRTKNEYEKRIFSDTLSWNLLTYQAKAFRNISISNFDIRVDANTSYTTKKEGTTINKKDWILSDIGAEGVWELANNIKLNGTFRFKNRSDKNGTSQSLVLIIGNQQNTFFKVSAGFESKIPEIQTLYWQSNNYTGNANLNNESISSVFGTSQFALGEYWKLGFTGRFKSNEDAIILRSDSTFANANLQRTFFSSMFLNFENERFEIESSGAIEHALTEELSQTESLLGSIDTKLWIRNSLFYKTYAFDRAAFVKLGVRTLLSPLSYESRFYNTELSYWQNNSLLSNGTDQAFVPAFFRLDAELSARVRAIMIVMRWENALDGFGQAGYFESSSFPMSPRRLIVGIRAQFRN